MRKLFRPILTLAALGMTMLGCSKSDPGGEGAFDPLSEVKVYVPGMS